MILGLDEDVGACRRRRSRRRSVCSSCWRTSQGSRRAADGAGRRRPPLLGGGHPDRTGVGGLLILVMGVLLALIPVVAYAVRRRYHEIAALAYVVLRSALEPVTYVVVAVLWLALVPVAARDRSSGVAPRGDRLGSRPAAPPPRTYVAATADSTHVEPGGTRPANLFRWRVLQPRRRGEGALVLVIPMDGAASGWGPSSQAQSTSGASARVGRRPASG